MACKGCPDANPLTLEKSVLFRPPHSSISKGKPTKAFCRKLPQQQISAFGGYFGWFSGYIHSQYFFYTLLLQEQSGHSIQMKKQRPKIGLGLSKVGE